MAEQTKISKGLNIELLSITIDSPIPVSLNNIPVGHKLWSIDDPQPTDRDSWLHSGPGAGLKTPGVFQIVGDPSDEAQTDSYPDSKGIKIPEIIDILEHPTESTHDGTRYYPLRVELALQGDDDIKEAILVGQLDGLMFKSKVFNFDGSNGNGNGKKNKLPDTITVEVFTDNGPSYFTRIRENIEWLLFLYDGSNVERYISLGNTPVELFWIYGFPGTMYKKGVWAEVLRLLAVECCQLKTRKEIIRRIVNYCHSGAGLRYDCYDASSHFGPSYFGGIFNLKAYLEKAFPFCNCYDQAAALQTFLGALGIGLEWVLMMPYGYINATNLIGRGRCNNPAFIVVRPAEDANKIIPEVVPRDMTERNLFGNHAFCFLDSNGYDVILDACVGPHIGDEIEKSFTSDFKQAYIDASIDGTTSLYSKKIFIASPGAVSSMNTNYPGIVDVKAASLSAADCPFQTLQQEDDKVEDFKKRIDFDVPRPFIGKHDGLIFDIREISRLLKPLETQTRSRFEEIRFGINIGVYEFSLRGYDDFLKIEICIGNNIESAKNFLINRALITTLPYVPLHRKEKQEELGHIHISNRGIPYYCVEEWWFFNIYVKIVAYNPSFDVNTLMRNIQHWLETPNQPATERQDKRIEERREKFKQLGIKSFPDKVANLPVSLPVITGVHLGQPDAAAAVSHCTGKITVGENVTAIVTVVVDNSTDPKDVEIDFYYEGNGLRFVSETKPVSRGKNKKTLEFSITFKGINAGITMVKFIAGNRKTLLCSIPLAVAFNLVS
jgi:hypothetical protein